MAEITVQSRMRDLGMKELPNETCPNCEHPDQVWDTKRLPELKTRRYCGACGHRWS